MITIWTYQNPVQPLLPYEAYHLSSIHHHPLRDGNCRLAGTGLQNGDFSDVSPHSPNPVGAGNYEQAVPPTYFSGETGFVNGGSQTGGVLSDTFYTGFAASPTLYDLYEQPDNNFGAGTPSSGNPGVTGIYQDLGALHANTKYSVTVYESTGGGNSYAQGASTFQLALYNGTNASTTPIAATTTAMAAPSGDAVFTPETVTFTTGGTVSGDLTLGLSAYDVYSTDSAALQRASQVFFANATLTSTNLPEPSSWALMLLGLGAVAMGARRAARA